VRSFWLLGLLAAIVVSAAQEVNPSASPTDTHKSETETQITADPPYYSLKQLKQWIEREKQQAKARVKALEESGAALDPAKRHKLEEEPENLSSPLRRAQTASASASQSRKSCLAWQ
jgi:uncharacterized membrane protein